MGSLNQQQIDYYGQGNSDLATETALTVQRLEPRRRLTKTATRTVIALVGLPARGKSFVARKLCHYLNWTGVHVKIFNVGKYRREAYASLIVTNSNSERGDNESTPTEREKRGACDANFFDATNERASTLREQVANAAMQDMLKWLDNVDDDADIDSSSDDEAPVTKDCKGLQRVAIFDATNSTQKRREWILESCTGPDRQDKQTGVVFVESICDDQELLEENYRYKVSSSPDFKGMDVEEALLDLRKRVAKYEAQYETITDDSMSYIKIFDLSTKLMVNHIYGRMAKEVVPALMAWHIGTRPIFLCRPGQTISGIWTDGEDYVNRTKIELSDPQFKDMSSRHMKRSLRGDTLGPNGQKFRDDLFEFCHDEGHKFMQQRASVRDMAYTGTSISGLVHGSSFMERGINDAPFMAKSSTKDSFPLRIYTSTMPRAADTVSWDDFQVNQRSNLNPLDKGDFAGMDLEEIKRANPELYKKLEADPYNTRFPGGESYRDLMSRLTSVVIDVEQEVVPTLVVSHVSILHCLMAYFRNTRVEKCMSIEVPLHTVIKFTPVRGGGWRESHHPFYGIADESVHSTYFDSELNSHHMSEFSYSSDVMLPAPIWGDGMLLNKQPS